ncbi:retrotransposon protein [Cucumis melo var. makuwa]|uniref:Retrotransposon protein n=1 Tax=Cucumis melo var. makuwa TaxID=1194695 RepID=A0A5D3CGG7_CUCMM|nr:retrotransposon protein [Cucumis melo var. makuwa]TYK10615.1 retrotransposon protein [Cucumis melo var. makuwa]
MSTSTRAPRHVWTKEEEGTIVECLMELVSMGGWKSDNAAIKRQVGLLRHSPTCNLMSLAGMRGLTCPMGTRSSHQCTVRGLTCPRRMYAHHDLLAHLRVGPDRADRKGRGKVSERAPRMDDMRDFIQMPDDERESFCRVLLRDISK